METHTHTHFYRYNEDTHINFYPSLATGTTIHNWEIACLEIKRAGPLWPSIKLLIFAIPVSASVKWN